MTNAATASTRATPTTPRSRLRLRARGPGASYRTAVISPPPEEVPRPSAWRLRGRTHVGATSSRHPPALLQVALQQGQRDHQDQEAQRHPQQAHEHVVALLREVLVDPARLEHREAG